MKKISLQKCLIVYGILFVGFIIGSWIFVGCTKFVDVKPPSTSIVTASVYTDISSASSAVNGLLETLAVSGTVSGGSTSLTALLGLSSDELYLYPTNNALLNQVYSNNLISSTSNATWSNLYNYIYQANAIIEGLQNAENIRDSLKFQFIGEAKFIRAYSYFYLVNIFGDVPLVLSTDYKQNSVMSKSSSGDVYNQIKSDLIAAIAFLNTNYVNSKGIVVSDRVRPNKGAACALLARVYIYMKDWANAMNYSAMVINKNVGNYSLVNFPGNQFSKGSIEAIWQLERPNTGVNTLDGYNFLPSSLGGVAVIPFSFLSDSLVNSFETADKRKQSWTVAYPPISGKTYYSPYKYQLGNTGIAPTEYPILLRLSEQFLISAQAKAEIGDLSGAFADLSIIRSRAGLTTTVAIDKNALLLAIMKERRVELFAEWGQRWFDLKRTNTIDSVMSIITPIKGGTWESKDALYPIPLTDIQRDPYLVQNEGY